MTSLKTWENPQEKVEIKQYNVLQKLDPEDAQMLEDWLKGPQVEIHYELNDDTDYGAYYINRSGKTIVTRVSECVTINGVRWDLQPGKNLIPKPVYEFLLQCPEQRNRMAPICSGQSLGHFRASA